MTRNDDCTVVTVPCFSGAPWDLAGLRYLQHRPLKTMRLPEGVDHVEMYADFLEQKTVDLDRYVIVGDAFGALVALAFAIRRPEGLAGLVLSGGFAVNPVTTRLFKARVKAARWFPGPFYRAVTLRFHAACLASPHDADGEVPWSETETRKLFAENTPYRSYVARMKAAFSASYIDLLSLITVPTLVLSPSYDKLIGRQAAVRILSGIPDAHGIVLRNTGLMFRYSHPRTYSRVVERFLTQYVDSQSPYDLEPRVTKPPMTYRDVRVVPASTRIAPMRLRGHQPY